MIGNARKNPKMSTGAMTDVNVVIENDDFIVPTSRPNGLMYVARFDSAETFARTVFNPFRIRHSPTFKFAIVDEDITPTSTPSWGGTFDMSLSINADIVIAGHLAIDLPKIEATPGFRCRWVDYPGVNIVAKAQFKSSNWDFETLTWVTNAVHRYFFIPKQNLDVYNEIVGQQNRREIYIADTMSPQLLALSNAIAIDPRINDSGILNTADVGTAYVGYAENSIPSGMTYSLVGVPQVGALNTTAPIVSGTDPSAASNPLVNVGDPATIDTTGSIIDGYSGLQTWKSAHEKTRIYHMFHFWWARTPQNALLLAAIATNLQTVISVQFRPFDDMYMVSPGGSLTTATEHGPGLRVIPRLTTAYVAEAVRIVFTHYNEQFIGNVFKEESQTINTTSPNIVLNPSEMVSEFFLAFQDIRHAQAKQWDRFNAYNLGTIDDFNLSPLKELAIKVGNTDRELTKQWQYWAYLRPYRTHENLAVRKYIFACPFTIFSDAYQPTSYVNFKTGMNLQLPMTLGSTYTNSSSAFALTMYIVYKQIRFFKYLKHTLSTTFS